MQFPSYMYLLEESLGALSGGSLPGCGEGSRGVGDLAGGVGSPETVAALGTEASGEGVIVTRAVVPGGGGGETRMCMKMEQLLQQCD